MAVAAVLALVDPAPVLAGGSCGGGGGDGGSSGGDSSGGDSSGGSDSSSDSSPSTPACVETSDVLGYRQCSKFGVWSRPTRWPRLQLSAGTGMRRGASLVDGKTGQVAHGTESFSYRTTVAPERAHDVAMLGVFRVAVEIPHGLYAAVDLELGGIVAPAGAATEMTSTGTFGAPRVTSGGGMMFSSLAVLGMMQSFQAVDLGLEIAGGQRTVQHTFDSSYHHCAETTTISATAPLLEARVRAERWLNPWLSVGATFGTSMIEQGAWMGGLQLGVNTRAFGGRR